MVESTGLSHIVPAGISNVYAEIERTVNCYYSNLIEGHETLPVDIERALKRGYTNDSKKRNLQPEAIAHIEAHKWTDEGI